MAVHVACRETKHHKKKKVKKLQRNWVVTGKIGPDRLDANDLQETDPPYSGERRHHIVGECEIYKEERHVLVEMRKIDECGMEEFGTLLIYSSEKTIAILGDRWWPQTVKQQGDKISKKFLCNTWKKRNERPNDGVVSIRSRNGAPSRKGCVVNDQTTT